MLRWTDSGTGSAAPVGDRGAQPEVPKPRVLRHNLRAPALPSGERSIRRPDGW